MNRNFMADYERFSGTEYHIIPCMLRMLKNYELRFLWTVRQNHCARGILKHVCQWMLWHYRKRYGLEIFCENIGSGLRLIHPWGITVNKHAVIGENVTLYKGVTIGAIDKGEKRGTPVIGNDVTIYANATVCGHIRIGNGAQIAAGAFVNVDVPDDAVVIGNPGAIHVKLQQVNSKEFEN